MNTKWNGRTFSLENFTGLYQSSFFKLQEADEHIAFQLPTGHTRVGYLLDKIQNNGPGLRADITIICIDMNDMRDDFWNYCCLYPLCGSLLESKEELL